MADFSLFDLGANAILNNAIPSTCTFALSTKSCVGSANGVNFTLADTYAGGFGEITGTGYARKTQSKPTAAARALAFALMSWATGAATDWPAGTRSVLLLDAAGTVLIAAWNLIAAGVARDLSQANTTENVTPTLSLT